MPHFRPSAHAWTSVCMDNAASARANCPGRQVTKDHELWQQKPATTLARCLFSFTFVSKLIWFSNIQSMQFLQEYPCLRDSEQWPRTPGRSWEALEDTRERRHKTGPILNGVHHIELAAECTWAYIHLSLTFYSRNRGSAWQGWWAPMRSSKRPPSHARVNGCDASHSKHVQPRSTSRSFRRRQFRVENRLYTRSGHIDKHGNPVITLI